MTAKRKVYEHSKSFDHFNRFMLHCILQGLGGNNIDILDDGRFDLRDQIGDLIHRPDPDEDTNFAPLRDERKLCR